MIKSQSSTEKLKHIGFKRIRKGRYYYMTPFSQYVVVSENEDKYSIEVDGNPIKTGGLTFDCLKAIINLLYSNEKREGI